MSCASTPAIRAPMTTGVPAKPVKAPILPAPTLLAIHISLPPFLFLVGCNANDPNHRQTGNDDQRRYPR